MAYSKADGYRRLLMNFQDQEIKIRRAQFLRGPNVWTYRSVMEVWLDLDALEDYPSNQIPGLIPRLREWLPALEEHHCGVGERGGFLQRLEEGTWAGHVLEHVVIELLNLAGMPTGFGQTRSTSQRGVYRMVFRARDEKIGRVALAQGHALLTAAIQGRSFDVAEAVRVLRDAIDDCYLGPSTASIVSAATDRGIPHIRLNDGNLVQLGYGARQRRIWTAETEKTSAIGEGIAGDKDLTKTLLRACGVPVPQGQVVASADEAWEVAQDLGLPVAVKPGDGNHGRGVTLDLNREEDVRAAFELARKHGREVLVERCISGDEHRLLVVGGRLVAAARGESAWIVGDGVHTVRELIDLQINSDPRRGTTEAHPLNRLDLSEDDVIRLDLQRQGLQPDSIVEAGRRVLVQRNGNVAIDCTDEVHPEVAFQAGLAARAVGLDIAGVDLVCEDVGRPLEAQGGAIVEVNAGPGLLMHLKPAIGKPRPVGQAIVEHLFSDAEGSHPGRIPIVGFSGTRHGDLAARLAGWLFQLAGHRVASATPKGRYIAGRPVGLVARDDWEAAQRLLMSRDTDMAVFSNSPELILDHGLPYDRCDVGVVTDMDGWAALAHHDIHAPEQMVRVLRTQMDVVMRDGFGVLNADDERVVGLGEFCDGAVILYGTQTAAGRPPALEQHVREGGRAAVLHEGVVRWIDGASEEPGPNLAAWLAQNDPVAEEGSIQGLLAGVTAAWAAGIPTELLRAGVATFTY